MNRLIDKNTVIKDYVKLKKLAFKCAKKHDYNATALYLMQASSLMYNSNLFYVDEELENLLDSVSERIITKKIRKQQTKKRIVFYDYFVLDNRGLTEQYLEALFSFDYELLFVGCRNDEKSKEIYAKLQNHNVTYKIVTERNEIKKAQIIYQIISDFSPQIIVAHTSPWDISAIMAINQFSDNCKRFLINITDHAFWLGAKVFDYFLEFRDYGYNISKTYRKIAENKLLKLPYYPNINKNITFEGFDFETRGKKLVFSGGSIYKIQGSTVFFDIVKHIISNFPDTIFLFLGNGDLEYIRDFIRENDFQGRVFCGTERKDIFEVFKHCDLYLNTYPLIGGLMTQYACVAGKLPLTLNDQNDPCNGISELMFNDCGLEIEFDNLDLLKSRINYYLNNLDILAIDGEKMKTSIISPEEFNRILYGYFESEYPTNKIAFNSYSIDIDKFAKQYIARLNRNKCLEYFKIFLSKKLTSLPYFAKYYMQYAISKIMKN